MPGIFSQFYCENQFQALPLQSVSETVRAFQ